MGAQATHTYSACLGPCGVTETQAHVGRKRPPKMEGVPVTGVHGRGSPSTRCHQTEKVTLTVLHEGELLAPEQCRVGL